MRNAIDMMLLYVGTISIARKKAFASGRKDSNVIQLQKMYAHNLVRLAALIYHIEFQTQPRTHLSFFSKRKLECSVKR